MFQQLFFNLVIVIGTLILAVTVHEYSHAMVARWLGDDTGKRMGRLTLHPFAHIDPMWTVFLPAMLILVSTMSGGLGMPLFAAGKPTPYNPSMLKRRFFGKPIPVKYAELLIAAAGPLSNLLLGFISLVGILILMRLGYTDVVGLLQQFIYLNVALCVFNLIPVIPLDGSRILMAFLSPSATQKYLMMSMQLSWVLLGVLIFGGGTVINKAVHWVVSGMTWLMI